MITSANLSIEEAARQAGVSRSTIEREIVEGRIPSRKIRGRRVIPEAGFEDYLGRRELGVRKVTNDLAAVHLPMQSCRPRWVPARRD